ncbi:MAG: shikimate kinase, partial [Candidatus Zixiibacteriota bacterium]
MRDNSNIVITGFMGTGKTTIGNNVAHKLNRQFYDTDKMIENRSGKTISQIFTYLGEKYFRQIENDTIVELGNISRAVISTGGGTIINTDN